MERASLDTLKDLNEEHYAATGDLEIASRIDIYTNGNILVEELESKP